MKISAFALTCFCAASSSASAEFVLQAAVNKFLDSAVTETFDARIMVGGLVGMISSEEVNLVSKEVVAAYNSAFGFDKAGQKLGEIKARGFSTIPADSVWWTDPNKVQEEAAFINAQVDVLYYKDGFGSFEDFGALHKQFEADLCDRLSKSTFSNFAHAKDCIFSFLQQGLSSEGGPVETAYGHSSKFTEAQLSLVGLKNEMTQADHELVNQIVTTAHNEAFYDLGLSLTFFRVVAGFDVGGHEGWLHTCSLCCPYDDDDPRCPSDATSKDVTIVVSRVSATGPVDQAKFMHTKISHADFEDFVCFKLRKSGSATFENVHDCSFDFVYNPVSSATKPMSEI